MFLLLKKKKDLLRLKKIKERLCSKKALTSENVFICFHFGMFWMNRILDPKLFSYSILKSVLSLFLSFPLLTCRLQFNPLWASDRQKKSTLHVPPCT